MNTNYTPEQQWEKLMKARRDYLKSRTFELLFDSLSQINKNRFNTLPFLQQELNRFFIEKLSELDDNDLLSAYKKDECGCKTNMLDYCSGIIETEFEVEETTLRHTETNCEFSFEEMTALHTFMAFKVQEVLYKYLKEVGYEEGKKIIEASNLIDKSIDNAFQKMLEERVIPEDYKVLYETDDWVREDLKRMCEDTLDDYAYFFPSNNS